MNLIDASLRFPTVIFSIGLGIALVYWLFVLLGALDIDLFGHGDIGGGHDVAIGGHDVGIGDAAEAGKAVGHDGDIDGAGGGGIWHLLGLGSVPFTISVSFIFLACWCASLLGMSYVDAALGTNPWWPVLVLPLVVLVGLPLAGLAVRPLRGVFALREGKSNKDYVGATCTITTGSVDDGFGQATIEDGGTVLVIPVRCDRPVLARGHKALIIDFDTVRHVYVVEPVVDMLGGPEGGAATGREPS
ncbi:MAG: hypothetical protein K8W52_08530 [Deltaproteobacteria bacterium]|nr:hypothetical protein [Deltaproteobacteria bacterium]